MWYESPLIYKLATTRAEAKLVPTHTSAQFKEEMDLLGYISISQCVTFPFLKNTAPPSVTEDVPPVPGFGFDIATDTASSHDRSIVPDHSSTHTRPKISHESRSSTPHSRNTLRNRRKYHEVIVITK